ncbi:MAG TPA: TetR/AcrR family transcriptional regulator [Virgibacillus sp.]|nr:TetR/AcrR family transcriptional regulator [Virgibacillus sp.]
MKISDYTSKGPGRPRSARSHAKILQATRDLLIEMGIHSISIEGVAKKAGVGKATIYRHWSTKEALISEAIGAVADEIDIPDTGDVWKDFSIVLNGLITSFTDNAPFSAIKKVTAGLMEYPALMDVYREQFINPRYQVLHDILEKGIQRGELREDIDVTGVIQVVGGSYFYTFFLMDTPLSIDDWLAKIKPIIMQGVAPRTE